MSYNPNSPITFNDRYLTAGSRLQIAEGEQLFEDRHNYGISPLLWETVDNTNGTVSHLDDEAGVSMSITGNSGDKLTRQTFEHFTYTPSEPLKFKMAAVFPSKTTNLRARVGAFTTGNGFFLEQENSTINVVRRTSVTGSAVDNEVAQSSWNLDTLDGSGDANNPSGLTLDLTKINLFIVESLWYGAGPTKVGFEINGEPIYVHEFNTANVIAAPITSTGNLPLRYEIENTGITSVTSVLKTYGASVITEGGTTRSRGYFLNASRTTGTTTIQTSRTHVMSIRPRTTFNSVENRVKFELESVEIQVNGSNPVQWEIGFGHTLTSASFGNVNSTYSAFDVDTSGTINTQPVILGPSGLATSSATVKGQVSARATNIIPVCLDAAGAVRDNGTIGLFAKGLGGTSGVTAVLNWREVY